MSVVVYLNFKNLLFFGFGFFFRMWRRTCLNLRLTGMEYRQNDLAQNEPVSFLHRPKPWLKQISLGGRTVCVVCPIVFSVYWEVGQCVLCVPLSSLSTGVLCVSEPLELQGVMDLLVYMGE